MIEEARIKEYPWVRIYSRKEQFVFDKDFANNFHKGQQVECEILTDGHTIVDGVAKVNTQDLIDHGHFITEEVQHSTIKEQLKSKATDLWQELNESGLPYGDFVEVQKFMLNLFSDIN